ncbi:hypothetical protein M595_2418 [Lyngbya aestuarii BL J]|uniref:SH3b domain-containing protein n=2 Tax=Lyngbya aestuarii TaxID=118322 RepID=U7QMF0_9CYAN|nr:hypothetical protein M595_2418 [Lyngbya aestuarii BL J]
MYQIMDNRYLTKSLVLASAVSISSIALLGQSQAKAASIRFSAGDFVEYRQSSPGESLYVWDQPCGNGLQGTLSQGSSGQISQSGYTTASCYGGTYDWYQTSFNNGISGWVAGNFLVNDTDYLDTGTSAIVRSTPSNSLFVWSEPGGGSNLGNLQPGTQVTVRETGPILDVFGGTYSWFRVDQGWVAGEFLQTINNPSPPSSSPPPSLPSPPPPSLPSPPPPPQSSSLTFINANPNDWKIPGFDHVALEFDGRLYESTNRVNTPGVSNDRTLQQVQDNQYITVARTIDISRANAEKLKGKISSKIGSGYSDVNIFTLSPIIQKGLFGEYTCVGLIEWAAEASGFGLFNQGYISGVNEYINYGGMRISTLTPSLLYWSIVNPLRANNAGLHMLLDPADFLLTDPMGRQFGYTQELGLIEEIPDVFYTGDDWAEQLALPDLLNGEYILEVFGLDDNVNVAFGNGNSGDFFSGYLAKGESAVLRFNKEEGNYQSVPEPSLIFGLLFVVFSGGYSLQFRKPF